MSKQGERWLRRRERDEEERAQREAELTAAAMPQTSEAFRALTRGFAQAAEDAQETWGRLPLRSPTASARLASGTRDEPLAP